MAVQPFVVSQINEKKNSNPKLLISEPWISDKLPSFPIELELILQYPANLDRLEIISHNQFIPSKIEILVKNSFALKSIGEVLFKYKKSARHELKTVYLDDTCSRILFRIHGCHDHGENLSRQVGIVEVKIIGQYIPESEENPNYRILGGLKQDPSLARRREKKYTTELEDLSRAISKNKERAIQDENFRLAKQAQLAERLLAKSITEMKQLELDKEDAIAEEDYQRASDLTEEMKTLRAHVLSSIDSRLTENVPSDPQPGSRLSSANTTRPDYLFDNENKIHHTSPKLYTPLDLSPEGEIDLLMPPRQPSSHASTRTISRGPRYSLPQPTAPVAPPSRRRRSVERVTFRPSSKDSIISRRSYSSSRSTRPNKFMEKENMVVPAALKNRQRKLDDEESGIIRNLPPEGEDHYLNVLTPKEHGDATRAAGVLGVDMMNKIFSRNFELRRDGLIEAKNSVQRSSSDTARPLFDAMVFILGKSLRDPLFLVYSEALELLKITTCDFMPRHGMMKNSQVIAASTVEPLLGKMGNSVSDKRTPQETEQVFKEIVNNSDKLAKSYLPHVMNSTTAGNRSERARAEIIFQSMDRYQAPNPQAGLAEETLRRYGVKCLMSSNQDVRSIGREIMLQLYERGDKRATRSALPIDGGRRSSLIQEIQRQMDTMNSEK